MLSRTYDESPPVEGVDAQMQDAPPAEPAAPVKKRPRLDLSALGVGKGERKRGKSMLGVLVNTLNKAKAEDKERNASEAVCSPCCPSPMSGADVC